MKQYELTLDQKIAIIRSSNTFGEVIDATQSTILSKVQTAFEEAEKKYNDLEVICAAKCSLLEARDKQIGELKERLKKYEPETIEESYFMEIKRGEKRVTLKGKDYEDCERQRKLRYPYWTEVLNEVREDNG